MEVRTKEKRLSVAVVENDGSLKENVTRGPPSSIRDRWVINQSTKYRVTRPIVLLKGLRRLFLQRNLELFSPFLQLIEVGEVGGIE